MRYQLAAALFPLALFAQGDCRVAIAPNSDYTFLVGSSEAAGPWQWFRNGQPLASGDGSQLFLLHADGSLTAADGQSPLTAKGVSYQTGRWGQAIALASGGSLTYPRQGSVDFNLGTIEMWVALTASGADPVYAARDHTLFRYRAANGDTMSIAQSGSAGIVYAGGTVSGQWESAYGGLGSTRRWAAGEWHHLAFTWSAAAGSMRFYVDGVLAADTNEKHYWPPPATADSFSLGDDSYLVDEVRISSTVLNAAVIRANAVRAGQPGNHEVWLPLTGISRGDTLTFQSGSACLSAPFVYSGVPLTEPDPPSTLLAPGTTSLAFSVASAQPTSCAYSLGTPLDYTRMTPFDSGQGSALHRTTIAGLSPDPSVVNNVYVRCASDPTYVLPLAYRSIPSANRPFPRKGNLWGSSAVAAQGLAHASRIDLYLGADFSPSQIQALRAMKPDILILTSINTVENSGLTEDYYLHDVHGKRIEVWPGTYRLNLTKPYVAEYQAQFAYQKILDSGLLVDGCFFDNFFTTESWLKADIYGNSVQIDANEDGVPDDPAWLDAAWHDGVYHELATWRKLMPYALASGHLPRPPTTEFSTIFNGDSIGFLSPEVADGSQPFQTFWNAYHPWWSIGRQPVITMVESAPPFQIGYGYDYSPSTHIPPSTLEFARTYYPYVRFGLAFALMNDGFFAHEFGDTWHGNDWWYDELDFNLGYPLGPAQRVALSSTSTANLLDNGGFEASLTGTWQLSLTTSGGAAATVARDTSTFTEGAASAHTSITASDGTDWHVTLQQLNRALQQGTTYDLSFSAKADVARSITVNAQRNSPDWRNYGLNSSVAITTAWAPYTVTFQANETVTDARIEFFMGARTGHVWLDDVRLTVHPPDVYRRDFTNGAVLLNGTRQAQTINVGKGLSRIVGQQAPRQEYILDDAGPHFSSSSEWHVAQYDSGTWKAAGPFYHTWGAACHQLDGITGTAQWDLALPEDGTYTIEAWWPAAPQASTWSRQVVFEVVSGGAVVASATLDQTTAGDQWHRIAVVALTAKGSPFVRVRNQGSGSAIADALHVYSAARYNDGSPASVVTLAPMDGIVLARNPVRRGPPRGK